ncbi:MAG TPA: oligosaccharide flippase family protein [Ferruginibacter sp.]|nr:oligosaccharide flippase family protein [Ferruginibacter sp.]
MKHIGSLWQFAINFFTKGHQRSLEAKKNIIGSLLIKGISIAIGLILVPLTIHYINPSQYGIWLTLSSMIAWISFFDIGFTHGLRNKFAEAKAKGDKEVARTYISTTYYYISAIFILLWVILMFVNQFISWHSLLSLPPDMESEVSKLAMLVFTYFCLQFIFRVINTILTADQQPAKASLIDMLGQLFALAVIFAMTKFTTGSLLYLGLAVGVAPTFILLAANIYFFNTKFKDYRPSLKFVKKEYAKDIMKLGLKFFVLQIAAIIQFETSLFIIAHYFGTEEVTNYNIAFKYFSVLQMVFMILLSPLWSGVTDAYNSGETAWIKNAVKKYLVMLIPFLVTGLIMLVAADKVYELWIGKNVVHIDFNISLLCLLFFSTTMFASIFVNVINGIGTLQIQFYASIGGPVCFFILSMLFIKYFHWGVQSVILSSILANVFGYIIAPIQFYNIFYKKSKARIWYR